MLYPCPKCKTPCLSANNGTRWFCRNCYEEVDSPQKRTERPSVLRDAKLGACREYGNEAEVVEAIRKELTARGWVVLRAGQFVVKGSGSDAGVPDLLCAYPANPPHPCKTVWLEVKFGKNKPTPAQQKLIDIGASHCVYSVAEALKACGYEVEI